MQGTCQDITDRKQAEAALTHNALHDPLTGLPNRALLLDRIEVALARSARVDKSVAVLFLDLDRFKLINDSRGHAAGDVVLRAVAERLRAAVRPSDTVGRLGGDEFVVVCEDAVAVWEATVLGERLIRTLEEPFQVEGGEIFVTVSVGIAIAEATASADELLRDADVAMYQAKQRGRARCEFFDEAMRTEAARRLETATALHRALERNEFETFYQPMIDLNSGVIVGVEALVRWNHPERGLVSPAAFIPLAEEQGLIVPIGAAVLDEACRQWARWRSEFPGPRPAGPQCQHLGPPAPQSRVPGVDPGRPPGLRRRSQRALPRAHRERADRRHRSAAPHPRRPPRLWGSGWPSTTSGPGIRPSPTSNGSR